MKFIYGLHLMWYEIEMLDEHLSSLSSATKNTNLPVEIIICINNQTYIERPTDVSLLTEFTSKVQQIYKNYELPTAVTFEKTDEHPFYNIGDFRREIYTELYTKGYVVWGEVDALLPKTYFGILESLLNDEELNHPHTVTFASRKMWDATWLPVEHLALQPQQKIDVPTPFKHDEYITQIELDEFNANYTPELVLIQEPKLDGALVALRNGLPQHIPNDMHFAREDFITQETFKMHGIPQYHVTTVLKGHNYQHPKKRVNTDSQRTDDIYKEYEQKSLQAGINFLRGFIR